MYANLRVTTSQGKELIAHQVDITKDGEVLVHLDDPEGPSERYANPAGTLKLNGAVTIQADW